MLTPAQIQSARQTLGVTPISAPSGNDLSSKLSQAWGTSSTPVVSKPITDIKKAGEDVNTDITTPGNPIVQGTKAAADVATTIPKVAADVIPGGKEALGAVSDVVGGAINTTADAIKWLGDKIGSTKPVMDFVNKNPGLIDSVISGAKDAAEVGQNLGNIANVILLAQGAGTELPKTVTDISSTVKGINAVHDDISSVLEPKVSPENQGAQGGKSTITPTDSSVTDNIRSYFAKDNIDPRLEASARRLEDPVSTYKDYSSQAEKAVTDVKSDPPIAKVGENIGNAYDKVINMRRTVGQNMASELEKVKDTPVDITEPAIKFIEESSKGQGKMTSFDKELITKYTGELKDLYSGQHPTASEVDDFLSRVHKELDVAKASKNITDVTNAERIIKGNLANIRDSLAKQPGMEGYVAARKAYSNLSTFLDEGSKYLGGKTQGGDYSRDVSVAKSSAESILSGGKKDWLLQLEDLTGYKALDDATLAIQAMKDVGDTRGLSLFKAIGDVGLSPTSLPFKVMEWGAKKVAGKIIGSPAEQTEAFLQSLKTVGAPK